MSNQIPSEGHMVEKSELLFDRFEVIKTLGQGGVGKVYQVRDRERNNEVLAVKILTSEIPFDEHTLDRFRDELALSKEIDHPNLIKAHDFIEFKNQVAFTMEYIEGEDLYTIFRRTKLNNSAIDSIMRQLLSALQAMHQHAVYHRDIKLENIMIRKDGVVKLTDLGLVKNFESKSYTKTGVLLGTAAYMPPEYIKYGDYDHRSDLYAVGIVLYELLTSRRRLENKNGNEIINHLIKTNFELSRVSLAGINKKYLFILDRATALEPSRRFSSADEMKAAFSEQASEESIVSEKQTQNPEIRQTYSIREATESRKIARQRWGAMAALLFLGVTILAVFALYLAQ